MEEKSAEKDSVVDLMKEESSNSCFLMMGTKVLKQRPTTAASGAATLLRQLSTSSNSKLAFNKNDSSEGANR